MTALVDTHAHIDLPEFDGDRDAVLRRALEAGVRAIVLIGYSPERWRTTAALCRARPWLTRAVGVHPNSAGEWSATVEDALRAELALGDAVAVGEIGLDYYREHASAVQQRLAFDAQLRLAREHGLPILIHQRNAEAEVVERLAASGTWRGVMHCFSGDAAFAATCLDLGLCLGIGGAVTYPKSSAIRAAVAATPLDRMLIETDAPFLAPQGRRGKRNEPSLALAALDVVATAHGVTRDEAARQTTANAIALFGPALARAVAAGEEAAGCA